jgi:hypothetical protein
VRCPGSARFYTAEIGTATGVGLSAGGGSWSNLCDVHQRRLHGEVNIAEVLTKVAQLPLHRWSCKTQDESIQHIGPMAQDFYTLFHLGEDSLGISTIDPDGIALAAIQELKVRTDKIEKLEAENEAMKERLNNLETLVQTLLAARDQNGIRQTDYMSKNITH